LHLEPRHSAGFFFGIFVVRGSPNWQSAARERLFNLHGEQRIGGGFPWKKPEKIAIVTAG
jgi:hypothetical protein